MMAQHRITLTYDQIFDDVPQSIDYYLSLIKKGIAQKISCLILEKFFIRDIPSNSVFIEGYFGTPTNNELLRDHIIDRISSLERRFKRDTIIFSISSVLPIMERCLSMPDTDIESTTEVMEEAFIKAILLQNCETIKKEDNLFDVINLRNYDGLQKELLKILCSQIAFYDTNNFINSKIINTQIIKACYFFEFVNTNSAQTNELLSEFLEYYNCIDWKNYLIRIFAMLQILPGSEPNLSISVNTEDDRAFFNKFLAVNYEDEQFDFKKLREYPVFLESENSYKIIFWLFIIEKIHKSLYFKFNELNDNKIKSFRRIITSLYSEQYLLYNLIDYTFTGATIRKSGLEMDNLKVVAPSDYYIRDKNNILLIECKDILFNAEKKHCYNVDTILNELSKKLFESQDGGRVGVTQLSNSINSIVSGKYTFDKGLNINETNIYPLLILHDRIYNSPGINYLLNQWFMICIQLLRIQGLNINNVHPLVIIDIDTFIELADYIKDNPTQFFKDLDKFTFDKHYFGLRKAISQDELTDICESFEYWSYGNVAYPKDSKLFIKVLEKHLGLK